MKNRFSDQSAQRDAVNEGRTTWESYLLKTAKKWTPCERDLMALSMDRLGQALRAMNKRKKRQKSEAAPGLNLSLN